MGRKPSSRASMRRWVCSARPSDVDRDGDGGVQQLDGGGDGHGGLRGEGFQVAKTVALPGGTVDAGAERSEPRAVPIEGAVPHILEALALHQGWVGVGWTGELLAGGHEAEVGNGLVEVERIVGEGEAEVHGEETAVAGEVAVPLTVDAEQDVATIPESRAEVDLFVLVGIGAHRGAELVTGALEAHGAAGGPMFEIGGDEGADAAVL